MFIFQCKDNVDANGGYVTDVGKKNIYFIWACLVSVVGV